MTISDPLAPPAPVPPDGPIADVPGAAPAAPVMTQPAPAAPAAVPPAGGSPAPDLAGSVPAPVAGSRAGRRSLDVLANVEMTLTVELGRTRMPVRQLLALAPGSVIELNRSANTPVDVFVNGTLFAHAEVVVIDDEFGVRITDIVERDDDIPERS